ncbi:MAG: polyphosphate kinase [Bacteroidia bacterium]|jgi:polyphosphate kinase
MTSNKINREVSWLSFNERVLQEAEDTRNPLVERMRFLGIFSNNLDEFFKVRVATIRRLVKLHKKNKIFLPDSPQIIMNQIHETVVRQQAAFNACYVRIIDELEKENIFIADEDELTPEQVSFVHNYYINQVEPVLVPIMVSNLKKFPYLHDDANYLFVQFGMQEKPKIIQYSLIEIPSASLGRFLVLPQSNGRKFIIYLDDVIRANLQRIFSIFNYNFIHAHVFKITRDAELDIDDDIVQGFYDKIRKSIEKRKKGDPVRFIYDKNMPQSSVNYLLKRMKITQDDNILGGGRYHNFKDFMKFPNVGSSKLEYTKYPLVRHKDLDHVSSILQVLLKKDVLLHYPYQSFDYVIDMLREAAISPKVRVIKVTLYRLAQDSKIINALINAVKNGKEVVVVIELQARFDEEANLQWAKVLTDEGVKLVLGVPGLKIHSKLILIKAKYEGVERCFAHIGTGNFHEGTAHVYSDISLLTSSDTLTSEVESVFNFIEKPYLPVHFNHLLVSPIYLRSTLVELIIEEINKAKAGKPAYILLKINALVDELMVDKLYEASENGVKIDLIVRGVCALIPTTDGLSSNIKAMSIIDKYLEHARIFVFGTGADAKYFISSADWMTRNLDYRIEVAAPIYDKNLKLELQAFLNHQLKDNVKARVLQGDLTNVYKEKGKKNHRAQVSFHEYLKNFHA